MLRSLFANSINLKSGDQQCLSDGYEDNYGTGDRYVQRLRYYPDFDYALVDPEVQVRRTQHSIIL